MIEIKLPHIAPLKFAKFTLEKEEKRARVLVEFDQVPTLPMLVEAAAQSSASFRMDDSENAFLVSLKNIELLNTPSKKSFEAEIVDEHRLENLRYVKFEIFEEKSVVANGTLVIAVQ
mgnify:CR=1 FL=1